MSVTQQDPPFPPQHDHHVGAYFVHCWNNRPGICGVCDVSLGPDRVFGLCRRCAEARHAARRARKMLRDVVRDHYAAPGAAPPLIDQ